MNASLPPPAPVAPAQWTPRHRSRNFSVLKFHLAIDDTNAYAFGERRRV